MSRLRKCVVCGREFAPRCHRTTLCSVDCRDKKRLLNSKKSKAKHHDECCARNRKYYAANRDKRIAYAKNWRAEMSDYQREKARQQKRKHQKFVYAAYKAMKKLGLIQKGDMNVTD